MPVIPVLVVSCGGTISSIAPGADAAAGGAAVGVTPALQASDLVQGLAGSHTIRTRSFSTVASSAMTLDDAVELGAMIARWVDEQGDAPCGVVVTQGTDTLEEIAYAVDLLWDSDTPIVFTGAMRNASAPGADGPANLQAAVAVAAHPDARGAGVLVVFNDRIHLAATVRKTHTTDVATFESPTLGPVGWVTEGRVRLPLMRRSRAVLPGLQPGSVPAVALFGVGVGEDGRLLDVLVRSGYRGLVIESLGGGHLPPAMLDRISAIAATPGRDGDGFIPVVLASRVRSGEMLRSTYAFPGSESDLLARGLVGAGALDGPKSRVLLGLLLAGGADQEAIVAAFASHGLFAGHAV